MSQYLEIAIDLTERADGSFEVKARSPAGTASARFKPPFTLADIGPALAVGGVRRGGVSSDGDEMRATLGSPDKIGVSLYQSLFQGAIAGILARTEGLAANRSDGGVRIRMNFNLLEGGTAALAALPWELMRKPGETDPLLVSTQTVLVRSLDVNRVVAPRPIEGPLRVLLIRANPKGTAALDLSREGELIGRSLSELPGVVVDEVDPVEDKIFSQLANAAYHVVHYMGHGDFAATKGGMLLLEDDAGNAVPTSAKAFAHLLRDEPLRLVFLNACDTGATPQIADLHPFAGVAAALVGNGVPAVVAMQFPITDRAALTFSKVFYARIAAGDAVDVAVAQGRSALYLAAVRAGGDDDAGEWATPVLYMRAEDGAVLPIVPAQSRAPAPAPAPERAPAPTPGSKPAPSSPSIAPLPLFRRGGLPRRIAMVAAAAVVVVVGALLFAGWQEQIADEEFFGRYGTAAERAIDEIPVGKWIGDGIDGSEMRPWQAQGKAGAVAGEFDRKVQDFQPENDTSARKEALRRLADGGNAKAAYLLVVQTLTESPADGATAAEATQYLLKAANGDVPAAMAALAERLALGQGIAEDRAAASFWLQKAREKCNTWVLPLSIGLPNEPLGAACAEVSN